MNKNVALWIGIASIFFNGFFALVNFNEWYAVAIIERVDDYHFGSEGPSPYYYRTPTLYATVTFTWGMLFLFNLSYLVWSIIKDQRRTTVLGFGMSVILFIVMFIHAQIGVE